MARKTPTHQQKKWVKLLPLSKNLTEAGLQAYDTLSHKNAYQYSYKNLHNPTVLSYMEQILNENGLNDSFLSDSLRKIIEKSTSKQALKKINPSDGLRGIEMTFRLRDRFPSERIETTSRELKIELSNKDNTQLGTELQSTIDELKKFGALLSDKT